MGLVSLTLAQIEGWCGAAGAARDLPRALVHVLVQVFEPRGALVTHVWGERRRSPRGFGDAAGGCRHQVAEERIPVGEHEPHGTALALGAEEVERTQRGPAAGALVQEDLLAGEAASQRMVIPLIDY